MICSNPSEKNRFLSCEKIERPRGIRDLLADETQLMVYIEQAVIRVAKQYGFREVRLPILEKTSLFSRAVGAGTEIVEKEMYTFEDKGGDSLTLRPEGTAGAARAGISEGVFRHGIQRWFYVGPMFRRERPQKGRYRQFQQIGIEFFGIACAEADVELILMSQAIFEELGLLGRVQLQLNTIGDLESRKRYVEVLVPFLRANLSEISTELERTLSNHPLRLLDSKDPILSEMLLSAPQLLDHIDTESRDHFRTLCDQLRALEIPYSFMPNLVRGLSYYNRTVFEWIAPQNSAQGAICGGGRYDDLVSHLGGPSTPAAGMAFGIERIALLMKESGLWPPKARQRTLCFIDRKGDPIGAFRLAEKFRRSFPEWQIIQFHGFSFLQQMKWADKQKIDLAFIWAKEESSVKDLLTGQWLAKGSIESCLARLQKDLK